MNPLPFFEIQQGDIRVAITPEDEQNSNRIADYIMSQLGITVQILLVEKPLLNKILSESNRKSGVDAVADWIENLTLAF